MNKKSMIWLSLITGIALIASLLLYYLNSDSPGSSEAANASAGQDTVQTISGSSPDNPSPNTGGGQMPDLTKEDVTFESPDGKTILVGMKKSDIDAILGTPEEFTHASRLTMYDYGNCTIYYRDDVAVHIKSFTELHQTYLSLGTGENKVSIGSSLDDIRKLLGEPVHISKPKMKLASSNVFYFVEVKDSQIKSLSSPTDGEDTDVFYLEFFVTPEDKVEYISMMDVKLAKEGK